MNLFGIIHLIFWIVFSSIVTIGASVWSGFTKEFVSEIPGFWGISFFYTLPVSAVLYLVVFFARRTFSFKIKKD